MLGNVTKMDLPNKLVGTRWLDALKNALVKCTLVAQEFATKNEREDLFAGTSPQMATKFLLSELVSRGRGGPGDYRITIINIKRDFHMARLKM